MGKSLKEYVNNLAFENLDGIEDIITVEHRSNNLKRDFLFCNKWQGKHIPANPVNIYKMLDYFVSMLNDRFTSERVLVIGFAETATALASYIAGHMKNSVYYLQTTREPIYGYDKLIEFEEEHSHATEQNLYGDLSAIPDYDYILFVDDEISTGKTILNFIREFNKINSNVHYGVASICNWQSSENLAEYDKRDIETFALIRGNLIDPSKKMNVPITNDTNNIEISIGLDKLDKSILFSTDDIFHKERTGRSKENSIIEDLTNRLLNDAKDFCTGAENVLVIGTEEFMDIPINLAYKLSTMGFNVRTQSTTRSPIDIISTNTGDYENEIVNKTKLVSAYDSDRTTYLYNLRKYDKIIVVTDSRDTGLDTIDFIVELEAALKKYGNTEENIKFIYIEELADV